MSLYRRQWYFRPMSNHVCYSPIHFIALVELIPALANKIGVFLFAVFRCLIFVVVIFLCESVIPDRSEWYLPLQLFRYNTNQHNLSVFWFAVCNFFPLNCLCNWHQFDPSCGCCPLSINKPSIVVVLFTFNNEVCFVFYPYPHKSPFVT